MIYCTDFNAPTYTNGNLVGQAGWVQNDATATPALQVLNAGSNGSVAVGTSGQDAQHPFPTVTWSSTIPTLLVCATINVSLPGSGDYFPMPSISPRSISAKAEVHRRQL